MEWTYTSEEIQQRIADIRARIDRLRAQLETSETKVEDIQVPTEPVVEVQEIRMPSEADVLKAALLKGRK